MVIQILRKPEERNVQRQGFIDSIKGFSILLVVMGHVIAWSFEDYNYARELCSPMLLWNIIYSFHMPLFMFISGYLHGFSKYDSIVPYLYKMRKKAIQLILPYITCGFIIYLWRGGQIFVYWYLLTLFLLIFIYGIVILLVNRLKGYKKIFIEVLTLAVTYCMLHYLYFTTVFGNISWFCHLYEMFPYFSLGCFVNRYFDLRIFKNNLLYSLCLILFCCSFIWLFRTQFFGINLVALSAIYSTFFLFLNFPVNNKINNVLVLFGRNTLPIYIFHLFFCIKIVEIGHYWIALSQGNRMEFVTCFVLELSYSFIISILIIFLSLILNKLIRTSKLISFMLLGCRQ